MNETELNNKEENEIRNLVTEIARILTDTKAEDVVLLDVRQVVSFTDYIIIATANSSTHISGLFKAIDESLKNTKFEQFLSRKVETENPWFLLDLFNFVIHIFLKNTRDYYQIERLYFNAKNIAVRNCHE